MERVRCCNKLCMNTERENFCVAEITQTGICVISIPFLSLISKSLLRTGKRLIFYIFIQEL